MGKYTADALDSTDISWLSDRADIVGRPLRTIRQIPFKGPNRNEDAISKSLLVVPQLSNPGPNRDPDAYRKSLLIVPNPMTGLRRQGGYDDAGRFHGGGHHGSGRRRGGFGLRGGFGPWNVYDYAEIVEVPTCYNQYGEVIPCPPAPADAYATMRGASGLQPRRAGDMTGPAIGSNAGDLSDPQDFVRSSRDWQGNPVMSTIPMRKFRDESHAFDGRLQNASGFGCCKSDAGLLPSNDWKKPFEKPDGRLYFSPDSWKTLPGDKRHELTVYWIPQGGGYWQGKNAADSAKAAATQAARKAQIEQANEQLSLKSAGKAFASYAKTALPVAQTIVSFVPGVGAGVNAAIAAGSALARGENITDAVVGAAKNMLPGGPLAAKAFDAAYQMGKAAATGGNIGDAALHVARENIPGGEIAKKAFDTGLAIAHGQNVQKAIVSGAIDLAKSQGSAIAGNAINKLSGQVLQAAKGAVNMPQILDISTIPNRAMNAVGPIIGAIPKSLPSTSLLPAGAEMVAKALLANPSLRSLPIATVAQKMNTTVDHARQGVASVVSALQKVPNMRGVLPSLAPAHDLANMLSHNMSLDSAMSHFASRAAPVAFSPNATKMARKIGPAREVRWHTNRAGKLAQVILKGSSMSQASGFDAAGPGDTHSVIGSGSTGPDVILWQNVLLQAKSSIPGITISKADGQFGPMTKASTQAWQRANGLTADGAVGPLTWSKALGTTPPAAQPVVIPPSASTGPQGDLMNMPSLPAVAAAVAAKAAQMTGASHQLIQLGSAGPDVLAWQKIIGVYADGQFGPETDAATRKWQAAHGLIPDGKVGPATWAAATGVSTPNPAAATVPVVLGGASNPTINTYLVTAGDTMYKIAQKFGGTVAQLAAANPQVKDINKIFVGQVLTLPASWGFPTPEAPPTPNPTLGLPPGIPSLGDLLGGGVQRTIAENPASPTSIPTAPLLPSISSTPTPEGPVVATTQDGTTVIDQPPITEKKPGAGLLVLGLSVAGMVLASGKKIFA